MNSLADIEERLATLAAGSAVAADADAILALGEVILEHWVRARGEAPTAGRHEGFRLLALHRQGSRDLPSFNACRETCRELAYHYNLLKSQPEHPQNGGRARMMAMLANHLCLFVGGKLESERLGEFCCASKPLRMQGG
ncbi:MAG TPA: hypothetical protein VMU86_04970 [Steroidobacteraceae bacterium]|nr:hypothetical protein [Steroidobacteraceae bacterium]